MEMGLGHPVLTLDFVKVVPPDEVPNLDFPGHARTHPLATKGYTLDHACVPSRGETGHSHFMSLVANCRIGPLLRNEPGKITDVGGLMN